MDSRGTKNSYNTMYVIHFSKKLHLIEKLYKHHLHVPRLHLNNTFTTAATANTFLETMHTASSWNDQQAVLTSLLGVVLTSLLGVVLTSVGCSFNLFVGCGFNLCWVWF